MDLEAALFQPTQGWEEYCKSETGLTSLFLQYVRACVNICVCVYIYTFTHTDQVYVIYV